MIIMKNRSWHWRERDQVFDIRPAQTKSTFQNNIFFGAIDISNQFSKNGVDIQPHSLEYYPNVFNRQCVEREAGASQYDPLTFQLSYCFYNFRHHFKCVAYNSIVGRLEEWSFGIFIYHYDNFASIDPCEMLDSP